MVLIKVAGFLFTNSAAVLSDDAHRIATEIEEALSSKVTPKAKVTTHLESPLDHHILHKQGD
jgi:divalent metal cation (Fe/Co/Zn/Cd) transporter